MRNRKTKNVKSKDRKFMKSSLQSLSFLAIIRASLHLGLSLCVPCAALAQTSPPQSLQGHVPAAAHLTPVGRLEPARELKLAVGLPWRNKGGLTNLLQRIYDPASPDYHHFLTPAQFAEMFGPTKEDYRSVAAFAKSNGLKVTATSPNRVLLDVTGAVSNIEKAFHVTLRTYQHPRENRVFYAPDAEPSLNLATPVLHISGLDNYLLPHPMNLRMEPAKGSTGAVPALGSGAGGTYQGNDFRAAYVPGVALTGSGQSVGLLEFDSGFFQSDINAYEAQASLPNVPVKTVLLDGYNGGAGDGNDEVSLDIEMAISMAPGLSSVIVYEGSYTDDILNRMATDDLANQLGASWTYPIDAESDQIFQQLAAQGQSFFNASGDGDAYVGSPFPPTDDPNLTSVGGTTLTTSGPGGAWVSETVWNWGDGQGGSGGISTTYPIPSWQMGVNMSANGGSTSYRNIPDVALTADNVLVLYNNGSAGSFGGTSCATPLWAAFTALVNEQAVAGGRPLLGFLNPAIYAIGLGPDYSSCFHDITTGNNTWSGSKDRFYAVPGYDLCTGWGTPAGEGLIQSLADPDALLVLPVLGFNASGNPGGPFSVSSGTLTLSNTGSSAINWSANDSASWLSVSPVSGALAAGQSVAVTVSLNDSARIMPAGQYSGSIVISDVNTSVNFPRIYSLDIVPPPFAISQMAGPPPSVVLTWTIPGVLQSSPRLDAGAAWTTIVGATSPYTNPIVGSQQFFRILAPTYIGNSLTQSGYENSDGDPPLVILGEYNPAGPLGTSKITLPSGTVQDVKFYGGNYNFTLYALSLVAAGPGANEQTFVVTATNSFSGTASPGIQTLPVTNFKVTKGQLLAFAGVGPYYPQTSNDAVNSDAAYESSSDPNSYKATAPGGPGTKFVVGLNPDASAAYEYIPDSFGNQGRTYAIGVDVVSQ
jgi:hypothetical protein